MAEIHHRFARHREMMFLNLIKTPAPLHHQPRLAQYDEMFHGTLVTATTGNRQFRNAARLARSQFPEHLPASHMADGVGQPFQIRQRLGCVVFRGSGG